MEHQQSAKCNKAKGGTTGTDQGGHLVASQFGGPGEQINLVPMNKSINAAGGSWYNMEQLWATKLQNGVKITDVKISIQYGTNGRPLEFRVTWKENGTEISDPVRHIN